MTKALPKIDIFLDTHYDPMTKTGSWASVFYRNNRFRVFGLFVENAQQHRLALRGVIETLNDLPSGFDVTIYSDNQYIVNSYNLWLPDWPKNNWKNASKKPIQFKDDWLELIEAVKRHKLTLVWTSKDEKTPLYLMAEQYAQSVMDNKRWMRTAPLKLNQERLNDALIP